MGHGAKPVAQVKKGAAGHDMVVDGIGIVGDKLHFGGGQRGDGAGRAHQVRGRVWGSAIGCAPCLLHRREVGDRGLFHGGIIRLAWRVASQAGLHQSHHAQRPGDGIPRLAIPGANELGAAAADVEQQHVRPGFGLQHGRGAGQGQGGFFIARDDAHPDAGFTLDAPGKRLAVSCLAHRGGGDGARIAGVEAVRPDDGREIPQGADGAFHPRLAERAALVQPLAQSDDAVGVIHAPPRGSGRAGFPGAGDQQAEGVGAEIDGGAGGRGHPAERSSRWARASST